MRKYPFTVSILGLFAGMTFILFVFLVGNFYFRGMTQVFKITQAKIEETNRNIGFAVTEVLKNTVNDITVLSQMSEEDNILMSKQVITKVMWEQLKSNGDLASIFLADTHGNFLQARRCPRFAVREIDNINGENALDVYIYKDKFFATTSIDISKAEYDPRTRKWYKALSSDNITHWSEPYIFASTGKPGITLSVANYNEAGVLTKIAAADFTLDTLSDILHQKSSIVDGDLMLFNAEGELIAASYEHALQDKEGNVSKVAQMPEHRYRIAKNLINGKSTDVIEDNGTRYVYFISRINNTEGKNWYLAAFIEESKIIGPIKKTLYSSILYSMIIIAVIYFPVQFFIRKYFIKPIKELKDKTQKVTDRQFSDVTLVRSRIEEFHDLSMSMVSMATSIEIYEAEQALLIDSIVKIMAAAVDDKSPYTGGHCERVPEIAELLAQEASDCDECVFKEFKLTTDDEWREFRIAAWLHDCGKVVTPEYVVDKATKLETIYNRIHEIRTRFEILYRDAEIEYYRQITEHPEKAAELRTKLNDAHEKLKNDFAFVAECNIGGEFMSPDKQERLKNIADTRWTRHFDNRLGLSIAEMLRLKDIPAEPAPAEERLLSDKPDHLIKRERQVDKRAYERYGIKTDIPEYAYNNGELYNLSVSRGTLTEEERFKINEHIIMTIKMLEELPFTDNLKRIPEYACKHHETMIGTGYPRKLTKEQISIPARIMAIADIFEALTASDRPYKKPKTLSESIKIMSFMVKDGHIDADLFKLFLKTGVYKKYADMYLDKSQIDEVDTDQYMDA